MKIIFLGPPGSGKGTQAARMASEFGMLHVSTGDVFREAIKSNSELGREIQRFVEAGKLVPDELVSAVVFEKLKGFEETDSVIIDGFPRTLEQARSLDTFSQRENIKFGAIVNFNIETKELIQRLTARRSCPQCKAVFNLESKKPQKENTCDNCGATLVQREDDKEAVVAERMAVYENQTAPILDYYKGREGFISVNAKQEIDSVYNELVTELKKLGLSAAS